MSTIGIPIKVLHEAEGHVITVEMKSGELFRGRLAEAEDSMNMHLQSVTYTARNGHQSAMDTVYIRGSKVRFMILPDMLKNAPMFRNLAKTGAGTQRLANVAGRARGRAAAVRGTR